jgi:ubiquinone/menaquinone biosynthesis C-methylase UbiE
MHVKISGDTPFPISFPPPAGYSETPVWTGHGFQIGGVETAILSYETGQSGWTDELTAFHEATAGEDHYIDRASRLHTLSRLQRWVAADLPVIIDIGCSSGILLKFLQDAMPRATILAADYIRSPLEELARKFPNVPLIQFDLTTCPLPDRCVDAVVLLNVLEHIERDEDALSHVARILKPGGVAIIEVPAGPELYDVYDKLLFHCRRYRMRELLEKIQRCGLELIEKSHLGFFLYPAFWATKKRGRRYLHLGEDIQRMIVSRNIATANSNPLMHGLMRAEAGLRNWLYYPAGIRCLVTCRQPE